jgi:two-component system chemotaxis response regulator CheY
MSLDYSKPVLVVDDYKIVARIIRRLLSQAGFADVDEANDGEEAFGKMKERDYGLVIADWHMAPTNGLELLQKAKADDKLKGTPFILVSADDAPENVAAARSAGANSYVVKPFDSQTLTARIESVLNAA